MGGPGTGPGSSTAVASNVLPGTPGVHPDLLRPIRRRASPTSRRGWPRASPSRRAIPPHPRLLQRRNWSSVDYAFSFRKPLTAGTHIVQVTNEGPQVHDVELVRLDPGASIEQFLQALEPGSYAFACLAPDRADGAPHFAHGMVYSFDVS